MIPLFRETHFTFRFGEPRDVRRFHLEGIEPGRRVTLFETDSATDEPLKFVAAAVVGEDGWVELSAPVRVGVRNGFVVVPDAISEGVPP